MLTAVFAATLTFLMPVRYVDGRPLRDEDYLILLRRDAVFVDAAFARPDAVVFFYVTERGVYDAVVRTAGPQNANYSAASSPSDLRYRCGDGCHN
jgi:hypothetical protein